MDPIRARNDRLVTIVGPTASGKSCLARALSTRLSCRGYDTAITISFDLIVRVIISLHLHSNGVQLFSHKSAPQAAQLRKVADDASELTREVLAGAQAHKVKLYEGAVYANGERVAVGGRASGTMLTELELLLSGQIDVRAYVVELVAYQLAVLKPNQWVVISGSGGLNFEFAPQLSVYLDVDKHTAAIRQKQPLGRIAESNKARCNRAAGQLVQLPGDFYLNTARLRPPQVTNTVLGQLIETLPAGQYPELMSVRRKAAS